jgi:hypothetical protein
VPVAILHVQVLQLRMKSALLANGSARQMQQHVPATGV